MFKKLKDKIAEEVKSSPQRIQQLTQSVTERIQNATSDESFFSIGDDDAPSSSPNPESGFSNVSLSSYSMPNSGRHRRNSNSSVASDMSFLPRYESATNLYHLQSDLDVSASEVEDNASSSSQLGHLSKEQIYAAFQKSQMRYHKYRGRYTDIANHYKELERENAKMKSVLVETQDKALRRVAELREQCSLEQKAKAHLENALRVELDEKQYVIDTLKTKVGLLQHRNGDQPAPDPPSDPFTISDDPAPSTNNLDILTKDLRDARMEIESLTAKMQELKANAIVFGSKEADFKRRIFDLDEVVKQKALENSQVLERERENNLIIAQTKMELHTEIQNRDLEIANLKRDVDALKSDLEGYESRAKPAHGGKLENLQSQNGRLIEKVEELTQKCNNYESELLKTEQLRTEAQNLNRLVEGFKAKTQALEEANGELCSSHQQLLEARAKLEAQQVEIDELQNDRENTKEENLQLSKQLDLQQAEYDGKLAAYRDDTKQHLLTLENRIKDKMAGEFAEKEKKIVDDFQEKLKQLSKHDNNVKETQLKLLEKEDQLKALQDKFGDLEDSLVAYTLKYNDLETNHLELISESSEVRAKLAECEKKNSELGEAVTNSHKQIAQLEDALTKQQSETCALQKQNTSLQTEHAELQNKYKAVQDEAQKANDATTLQTENARLESDNASLHEKLAELVAKLTKLQQETAMEKATLHDQISDLTRTNSDLHENCATLTETNRTLQSATEDKTEELSSLRLQITEHVAQSNENSAATATLRQELELTRTQLTESSRAQENSQKVLDNTKQNLLKKIKEQKAKFHDEIQTLKNEIVGFKQKNEAIQLGIDEYKQKLGEYEAGALEKNDQFLELTSDNLTLRTEIDSLKKQLENSNADKSTRLRELQEDLSQKLAQETSKLQEAHASNASLQEELSQLQSNRSSDDQKLRNYESECASLKTETEVLRNEVSRLKELETQLVSLRVIEGDYENLQADKLQLVNDVTELQTRLNGLSSENRRLGDELSRSQDEVRLHSNENEKTKENQTRHLEEIDELKRRNNELSLDYKQISHENEALLTELAEAKLKCETLDGEQSKFNELSRELDECKTEIEKLKRESAKTKEQEEAEKLDADNRSLRAQLGRLEEHHEAREKHKKDLEAQLRELEHQYTEISHERQLLRDEVQELKISPINIGNHTKKLDNLDIMNAEKAFALEKPSDVRQLQEVHEKEIHHLNEKLVQYKSLDLTNRSSIQFYENELQKLKNKNEKLNRKLDETLVTLNHCAELSTSTETEYLRNVLYNYMLGKEGMVLARVIAAVCKFDDLQTDAILQREQQKQTLLGQLGFLP